MNTGLYRLDLSKFAAIAGHLPAKLAKAANRSTHSGFGLLGVVMLLMAGFAVWMALPGDSASEGEAFELATAGGPEAPSPAVPGAAEQAVLPNTQAVPEEVSPAAGLRISSQHWRRGGLGSNALVTFTLRNGNDYAVRDIEISCAFSRGDGSHLTDRTRVIHDTVRGRGRKTFARLHIGFVNVNADRAKCVPVTANHI